MTNDLDSKVSVIITSCNSEASMLRIAIQSVLEQTYNNIELIVVDDGSDIPFAGICREYDNSSIIWLSHSKNYGVARARNYGLDNSTGEYVAFLDHDDWWEPKKIDKQLRVLKSEDTDWVYCGMVRHFPSGRTICEMPKYKGNMYTTFLKGQAIPGSVSSVLVKRNAIVDLGGFDELKNIIEDWDMWIRLSRDHTISYVDEVLVHLSTPEGGSRSKNIEARLARLNGTIEKHKDELMRHNLMHYAVGRYCRVKARLYQQSGDFPNAILSWFRCIFRCSPVIFIKGFLYTFFITLPNWLKSR